MRKKYISSIMVASLLISSASLPISFADQSSHSILTEAQQLDQIVNPFNDIQGHWGEDSIKQAFVQGYISASPTGKFNPNQNITRAEFLKMIIEAQEISVESQVEGEAWYAPYIAAGQNKGIYKAGEFKTDQWTQPITRQEMATLAVRSIGAEDQENDHIYVAVQKGLISGTGNGKLSPDGKTTRAQAITIIERVLKISEGQSLPVDDKALSTAEQVKNAPKDPWGRAIRTTNLPSNYKDFPYILADAPNELYDLKHEYSSYHTNMTPAEFLNIDGYNKVDIDKWAEYVEQFVNQIVNVDYTTLDQSWGDKLIAVMNESDALNRDITNYIKKAKENKVKITGTVKAEPSIVFLDGYNYMRVYFTFKVTSFNNSKKDVFFDDWKSKINFKKNVEYEGYSNIPLGTAVYGVKGDLSYAKIIVLASLFKEATYKAKER